MANPKPQEGRRGGVPKPPAPAFGHGAARDTLKAALRSFSGEPRSNGTVAAIPYAAIYYADPADRIAIIKVGISAAQAKRVVSDLAYEGQQMLLDALHVSTATVNRKAKRNEALSTDESERILGLAKLVGQVQAMVEESGDPTGFDATEWLSRWLSEPLPALGGQRPIELLDTMEGQALVSTALAQIQSGAYV